MFPLEISSVGRLNVAMKSQNPSDLLQELEFFWLIREWCLD